MTVQEAGRKGGERGGKKGGETTRDRYGHEFYEEIGRKGGNKVRDLINAGKKSTR
jgi:general stress protein YciG